MILTGIHHLCPKGHELSQAQSVKCWLQKDGDPGSDPLAKSQEPRMSLNIQDWVGRDRRIPGTHWLVHLAESASFWFRERACLRRYIGQVKISSSDFWPPQASCMCTCMHMNLYTYMYMYTYQCCPGDTLQLCCCVSVSLGESLHLSH